MTSKSEEELWVRSPCSDIEPIINKTVTEVLWEKVIQWGDAPALECGVTGRKYTYTELYRNSQGFAASLTEEGIQRGDVLAIVLPNTAEFPIILFGAWDAGCVVSPINPAYTLEEIMRQLSDSGSKWIVTSDHFLPTVLKAREACPSVEKIVVVGNEPDDCLPFFELIKREPAGFKFLKGCEIDPLTTTVLMPYSSGTTGPPKGVKLTHANIIVNTQQFLEPDAAGGISLVTGSRERTIGILPFFHVYGLAVVIHGVFEGTFIYCLPRFEPIKFMDAVKSLRPTVLRLVPPLIMFLCQTPNFNKEDWSDLKRIIVGAAASGPTLINKFLAKTNNETFYQKGYGMTELSPITHVLNPWTRHAKIGSFGTPLPSTICKIVDCTTGITLGANEKGELCVRGPQVMQGYLNNDKATSQIIDSDGWLHTGDICYYDEDKHFYIVDRLKELIKVKGFQVAPSELEDLLREHKDVKDVAVIGVPDEESGELPRAYIVSNGQDLTAEKINEYLKERVATYNLKVELNLLIQFLRKWENSEERTHGSL